jgi:hypothetical protein
MLEAAMKMPFIIRMFTEVVRRKLITITWAEMPLQVLVQLV